MDGGVFSYGIFHRAFSEALWNIPRRNVKKQQIRTSCKSEKTACSSFFCDIETSDSDTMQKIIVLY